MTYVIVHALAPIFIIMLLGFWAGKAKLVDNKNVALLNIFVMDFALPAALFSATVQTPWSGIVQQSPLIVVLTLAMWITYAAIYFLAVKVFHKTPQDAAVLTLTVALPNYAALGLPILGSVLGDGSSTSLSVAVSIACGSVLMTPFCLLILEREKARASGGSETSTLSMLPVLMWRSLKKTDRVRASAGCRVVRHRYPYARTAVIGNQTAGLIRHRDRTFPDRGYSVCSPVKTEFDGHHRGIDQVADSTGVGMGYRAGTGITRLGGDHRDFDDCAVRRVFRGGVR
ncbi:hypothetical protein OS11_34940 [Dickeya oryzae]